jgi:hypothetical protein
MIPRSTCPVGVTRLDVMLAVRLALLAVTCTFGCGGGKGDTPVRSPTLDYPLPASQTSDGEVVGVDRVPPGDKLQEGVEAGSAGVNTAGKPGAVERSGGGGNAKPRPCAEIGLEDESGKSRCKPSPK